MCSFVVSSGSIDNLEDANRYIKFRGPDYTNVVTRDGFTAVHNLLSITGDFIVQPFTDEGLTCVYVGETYNYREFGEYPSDGCCLLDLYKEHGPEFVRLLDGEYAICIIDARKNLLLVATDVFATKPLWVNTTQGFTASIYESPLRALGLTGSEKVPANLIRVYGLKDFQLQQELPVYEFDLRQHKETFDDWTVAFERSIEKRTRDVREKVFVGMSSGYDSGAIVCELLQQGLFFKAYVAQGTEDVQVVQKRHDLICKKESQCEVTPYRHGTFLKAKAREYIVRNVEPFMYRTYSSSSDYNEFGLCIHDDNGASGLSHVASLAKRDGYKIYLSGQGADEIFSDYGFGGKKIFVHSNFGGLFPEDLSTIFPWPSFYDSSQLSYLMKEEAVAGSYGLEARYPYLDKDVVQEFLWLSHTLKNKWYKSVLHNYLTTNNFPFAEGVKIGF